MDKNLSFKISWLDKEEKFLVKTLWKGEVTEENKFEGHHEAMLFISDEMSMCLTCQEEWTLTY